MENSNNTFITKEEKKQCRLWGEARVHENRNRRNIPDYDTKRFNLTEEDSNSLAVLAEYYVYKQVAQHLGWSLTDIDPNNWAPFVKSEDYGLYLGQPDIGGVLEVRRANRMWSPIPVRKKDVENNALVVQVYVPYTQDTHMGPIRCDEAGLQVMGWVDARQVWDSPAGKKPTWSHGDTKTTLVRRSWEDFDWGVFNG